MMSSALTRREFLAWIAAIALVATFVVTTRQNAAGAGFAVTLSTRVVYIATGTNFPDALGAASPAALDLGPVLLVQQNAIPQATLDEINRLEPRSIVIVGGLAAISQAVEDQLDALVFNPAIVRISGADRYITAAALSAATFPTSGKYPRASYDTSENIIGGTGGSPFDAFDVLIEAPDSGILVINAGADFGYAASGAVVSCWIWLDENTNLVPGSLRFTDLDSTNSQEDCSTQTAVAVDPGVHTVAFRINQDANVNIGAGAISVIWIPFASFGQIPAP
jgi:hypothetical protein